MIAVKVKIVRYISDDPQPGIVECELVDAHGRRWQFVEKTAIVSSEVIDAHSCYPKDGLIDCEIANRIVDESGREIIKIDTVESVDGVTQFDVLPDALSEL